MWRKFDFYYAAKRFLYNGIMYVVICDIDSTISDCSHRLHFLKEYPPNWNKFLSPQEVIKDIKVESAEKPLYHLMTTSPYFYFLTSRQEYLRNTTNLWLQKEYGIVLPKQENLIMRPTGQESPASEHKIKSFEKLIKSKIPMNLPIFVFDDDLYTLARFRSIGALTFKAPECWKVMWHDKPKDPEPIIAK